MPWCSFFAPFLIYLRFDQAAHMCEVITVRGPYTGEKADGLSELIDLVRCYGLIKGAE